MYDNIGGKIKGFAFVSFFILTIASVISGIGIWSSDDDYIMLGILVMVLGPFLSWMLSWLLYGFGELIDKVTEIEKNTRFFNDISETQAKTDSERFERIEKLRSQGLITEEEYKNAITK